MISKNQLKHIKSLHLKKNRDAEGIFLVEGEKSVEEVLLVRPEIIVSSFVTKELNKTLFIENNVSFTEVTEQELRQLSLLNTPNKAFLVCRKWKSEPKNFNFIIALDNIQDPGNMGTLIRLADWFGVDALLCSKNTVDHFNPKVVQAAMGSILRTNIIHLGLAEFLQQSNLPIYGAVMDGENVYQKKLDRKGILILGNEGNGISDEIQTLIQHRITIPKIGETESLNVATAGAILLSEFCRKNLM